MGIEQILSRVNIDLAKKYLKDMIRINSVTGHEERLADYIVDKLTSFGIDNVKKRFVEEGRCYVTAFFKGDKPGMTTLLTGHLDTISPGDGWDTDPFEPVEKEGRVYGRGANDMKGGLAIILAVAQIAAEHKSELPGSIKIAFVPDEEAYSAGIIRLIEDGVEADFGISADPEFYPIIVGAAGKILIRTDVDGMAADGATPQLGINAVVDAAKFVAKLETIALPSHEKIPAQPFVPLRIEGGFKDYEIIVPDHCSIIINKHTVPGETKEMVLAGLEKLEAQMGLHSKFSFSIEKPFYPPYIVPEDHAQIQKLCACFEKVTGKPAALGYGDAVSDNNHLVSEGKIPVVCFGPGGGNMHSPNEWVSVEEMEFAMFVYLRFLFN